MKHIIALLVKLVIVSIVLGLVLLNMTRLTLAGVLYISLTVTIVAYVIGDLWILRYSNNTTGSLADVVLTMLTVYMFNYIFYMPEISFTAAFLSALLVGVGEFFYHKFVVRLLRWPVKNNARF